MSRQHWWVLVLSDALIAAITVYRLWQVLSSGYRWLDGEVILPLMVLVLVIVSLVALYRAVDRVSRD